VIGARSYATVKDHFGNESGHHFLKGFTILGAVRPSTAIPHLRRSKRSTAFKKAQSIATGFLA